ncbi:MAG: DUF3560 domain-containing protein [Eubacterium sp.]|nr:DUF3560 domain-containing protein [Eubacterium sp.]
MTESRAYIFNLETTKIELHFEKAEYDALSAEQKQSIKSAFLWSNRGKCWVSRAKEPNLYHAIRVAKSLGFTEEQREGERLTFAEQVERQTERAEARAERLEGYAENAANRAEQLQKPLHDMHGDIAFFTQPNINSAGGRAFTRSREKIFERYEKGFDEYRKSSYFLERAETARKTASQTKYSDPAYLDRRIKECKKEIEKRKKNALHYEEMIQAIERGEPRRRISGEVLTADEVREWYDNELELIEVAIDKQAYLENCLDALGGIKFSRDNIKPGYIVKIQRWGLCEIVGTGPLNVTYKVMGISGGNVLQAAYAEILEVVEAREQAKAAHPFKVGEKYTACIWENGKHVKAVYEIIKATNSTIQLKRKNNDEKPITRKPKIVTTVDGNKWRFGIDDYGYNCFYKEV